MTKKLQQIESWKALKCHQTGALGLKLQIHFCSPGYEQFKAAQHWILNILEAQKIRGPQAAACLAYYALRRHRLCHLIIKQICYTTIFSQFQRQLMPLYLFAARYFSYAERVKNWFSFTKLSNKFSYGFYYRCLCQIAQSVNYH